MCNLYTSRICFSTWIQWWCLFCDQTNPVIYSAPQVCLHSTQTVWSPSESVCTLHGLCRVRQSVWTSCEFGVSARTLCKNCTLQGLNQAFNNRTNSSYEMPTLPLYHCCLSHLANLCYICNLWLNWETYLLLFNMGHMIYVLDKFFDVNSMAAFIVWLD